MFQIFTAKLQKLIRGEDGFAVALTILIWPLMLLGVSGILVTGETVRRKMILQNAADAAAHAGAMVQADTLSRIAVINRMMAWTYIQANKMEMDYTVVNWALFTKEVMDELKPLLQQTNLAASATCADPVHKAERTALSGENWGWYAGDISGASYVSSRVLLNGHAVDQEKIQSLTALQTSLSTDLEAAFSNITSMNKALAHLKDNCGARVSQSIREVFAENTKEFGAMAVLWARTDRTGDHLVPMEDENAFLALAGSEQSESLTNAKGISWWQPDGEPSDGFRRTYSGEGLKSTFSIGVKGWQNSGTPAGCVCYAQAGSTVNIYGSGAVITDGIPDTFPARSSDLDGDSIMINKTRDTLSYNASVRALPRQLTGDFIHSGTVLVGAKLPHSNPLGAVFGDLTGSWFDAHSLSGKNDLWCISAARACAKTASSAYSVSTLSNYSAGNADYTAVMLPAAMAGSSAGAVAQEVYTNLQPEGWSALADWSLLNNFASGRQ